MTARSAKPQPSFSPVYLVGGSDAFLVSRQTEQLMDRLLPFEQRQTALWVPSPDDLPEAAEIFDELRTLPFLADRRVVLIKEADGFLRDHRQRLEKYLENPSPTGVLILQVGKIDNRTRLTKAVAKLGGVIETGAMKPYELPKFAVGYCRQYFAKTLSYPAAQMLVEFVGDQTGRICSEMEKLAVYVGSRKTITPEDIQTLIGHNRMYGAFEVIDAITAGRTEEALRRLRNMFEADKSAEYTVIGAFAYHFRKLFSAGALLEQGLSRQAVAKKMGLWKSREEAFFAQLRAVRLEQLGRILARLGRLDFGIKTGRTSAPSAMERFILEIQMLFAER